MTCSNCGLRAHYIQQTEDGERCENCGGFSVSQGSHVSGILTRNSYRVRRQQSRHEGDMVQPHVWDKASRKHVINPDFIKLYPDKAKDIYREPEMVQSGYTKLPEHSRKLKANNKARADKFKSDVEFHGKTEDGAKRLLGS